MFLIDLIIGYLFAIITQFINVFVYSKSRKIKSRNMTSYCMFMQNTVYP